jgi:hypothetical protein
MRDAVGGSTAVRPGLWSQLWSQAVPIKKLTLIAGLLVAAGAARAEPASPTGGDPTSSRTSPDPPQRKTLPKMGPSNLPPSWDLDGFYVWLGPSGAASHVDADWDSTIGADLAMLRIREHAALGAIGGSFGASRWTARGGGRLWLDALAGTRLLGRMVGVSAGPILELSELAHPRIGVSTGVWVFAGITPFARIGTVRELGMFGEVGIHIALPVYRRRR